MYVVPEGRRKLVLCELLCPGVELYSIIGYLNDAGIIREYRFVGDKGASVSRVEHPARSGTSSSNTGKWEVLHAVRLKISNIRGPVNNFTIV
jgi:hypothetical protein